MLKKSYTVTGKKCRVTFHCAAIGAASAALAGEFNGWSATAAPMKKLKSGEFAVTLTLDAGQDYAFRYVVDGTRWVNEPEADSYVRNEFGEDNSVVTVPLPE